jgi:hypothetical protein
MIPKRPKPRAAAAIKPAHERAIPWVKAWLDKHFRWSMLITPMRREYVEM